MTVLPAAPTIVLDVDLAGLPAERQGLHAFAAAHVLVRLQGWPVGRVTVPIADGCLTKDAVVAALLATHLDALGEAAARAAIESRELPSSCELPESLIAPPGAPLAQSDLPVTRAARRVTVAVCTRDRPRDLERCLDALSRLRYPFIDLLVVDNAPRSGESAAVVAKFPRVRYVQEPRPGLDWARNRAVLECRGEILAFTDDDTVVDPGWVDALVGVFDADPSVMAVTGLVVPLELDTRAQRLFEAYGGFGRGVRRRWFRARPGRPAALEFGGAGAFGTGANMAYRLGLFDLAGGFDCALDVGTCTNGGGDLDMFFRALKHGQTLVYEPAAIVRHQHRRDDRSLRTQITNNGIGFYAYLAKLAVTYPDERVPVLRLGLWWFAWWSLRRLARRLLGLEQVPLDLIVAELIGSIRGIFRYRRAQRHASMLASAHPAEPRVERPPAVPPPADPLEREAVRQVDIAEGLQPLADVAGYRRVHVFVFWGRVLLGRVVIQNRGAAVSVMQLQDAIVDRLAYEILDARLGIGPDRFWRVFERTMQTQLSGRAMAAEPRWRPDSGQPFPGRSATRDADGCGERLDAGVPVSVVVATRDRAGELRSCLASLVAQQTPRPFEIIVVDNHPASAITPVVVNDFPGVRLVAEPRPGLSYARNRGILAASGEIVLTTDDDVVCPPEWMESLVAPFRRARVMVVTGNVLPMELETPAQQLFELYGGLGRGYRAREVDAAWCGGRRRSVPTWELGCTANAAFRASIFTDARIGLMDEALGAGTPTGCSEDTDLFYKVLAAGGSIAYEPRAYVWHRHRRTMEALAHQLYSYSKGHVAYQIASGLHGRDPRALVRLFYELPLMYARRTVLRLVRRSDYPLRFIALEIRGNLAGPWALWQSRRRVRKLGPSAASPLPRASVLRST